MYETESTSLPDTEFASVLVLEFPALNYEK